MTVNLFLTTATGWTSSQIGYTNYSIQSNMED